jgi:polyphosphate kinase 2 (PPK2 family)
VEGFCSRDEWKRAYEEINNFERTVVDGGAILCKFYIHIGKKEQLTRFEARANDPYKRWKINEEDWRNREKWELHNDAAEDMFEKTDTPWAPWHLVEGNFKWHARIKVLRAISKRLQEALKDES